LATLKAMFRLFDGYSTTIDRVMRKTDQATNKILNASGATDKFNDKLKKTGAGVSDFNDKLSKTGLGASGFKDSMNKNEKSVSLFDSKLGKLLGTVATVTTALKGMKLSDELVNTSARLNLINDGRQTQAELQEKIYAAATRSRGEYGVMADSVARLQLLAGDAFSSNGETIAFTELLQKAFKVSGATSSEQSAAMLQLSQAMASGRLQGDEFVSISENAPLILEAISRYTGKSRGELKEMSSDGAISADIIKKAMFSMADDINAKFATMPITFGDLWNKIKNGALSAFTPISNVISNIINSEGFMSVINALIIGVNILGIAIGGIIDFILSGWDLISPFLISIATIWLVQIITQLWAMIPPIVMQAYFWALAHGPMIMYIALIVVIIQTLSSLGVTFEDVFSFIGGLLGVFYAYFYNKFILMWNTVAAFANFFGNVFKNPVASVQNLFYDMAVNILGFIEGIAKGIEDLLNKIPGVNVTITSAITGLKNGLASKSASIKDEAGLIDFVQSKEFMSYSEGATLGSNLGKATYGSISGAISKLTNSFSSLTTGLLSDGTTGVPSLSELGNGPDAPVKVKGTGKNDSVKVDMADEDLQYLRDIAEREYINKFSTATLAPNIQITFGDVHEEADADKVAGRIQKILREQIAIAGEGAY